MSDSGKGKIDLSNLVKILNLTQSDADGEALNAIRMANSKIKAAGLTWQDVLVLIPKKERPYKFKEAPKSFSLGFFKNAAEHQEFINALTRDQHEWLNKLIRYCNKYHELPDSAWTDFRDLWYNFREAYHQKNK